MELLEQPKLEYNRFPLSHEHKTTMRFGKLYPVEWQECLPGDQFQIQTNKLTRFLPMLAPVMHRVRITEHWYFVPNRIMWNKWEDFITGRDTEIESPYVDTFQLNDTTTSQFTLGGYMGLPLVSGVDLEYVSAFPLKAYIDIYNHYYRHQQLETPITWDLVDGENAQLSGYAYHSVPLNRYYEKTYWTSMLNSAQRGLPVRIPLSETGTTLDIYMKAYTDVSGASGKVRLAANDNLSASQALYSNATGLFSEGSGALAKYDPNGTLAVSATNAATIETFRASLALQSFFEKDWRTDLKYNDIIQAHFGRKVPDWRLSDPEYIGGDVQYVQISEVLSQTESIAGEQYTPLGTMAGHGISAGKSGTINYTCNEHGILMCIISITPDWAMITRGLTRRWTRSSRLDYAWPTFAHLGDQAVMNTEIHVAHTNPTGTFGYQEQYKEYKQGYDMISGMFQDTLKHWHYGIDPDVSVTLSNAWLQCNETLHDLDRTFYTEGDIDDYCLVQLYFDINVLRKLPKFNVPQLVG